MSTNNTCLQNRKIKYKYINESILTYYTRIISHIHIDVIQWSPVLINTQMKEKEENYNEEKYENIIKSKQNEKKHQLFLPSAFYLYIHKWFLSILKTIWIRYEYFHSSVHLTCWFQFFSNLNENFFVFFFFFCFRHILCVYII